MNEKQLRDLVERILYNLAIEMNEKEEKDVQIRNRKKAYVIVSEKKCDIEKKRFKEIIDVLCSKYEVTVMEPEGFCGLAEYQGKEYYTVKREAEEFQEGEYITVFTSASRNLIAKTALCIQDDFESKWVAQCIEHGQSVYMYIEQPTFTGKEPAAYRKTIEAYIRGATAFGIRFNELPMEYSSKIKPTGMGSVSRKKQIITLKDVENSVHSGFITVHDGDVITDLAKEYAESKGIKFSYE